MLTIFSIPKPFVGHAGVIQRNALRSWTRVAHADVVLFGDDEGVAVAAAEFGARHVPDVKRTEFGTPYLSGAFETAAEIGAPTLCWVNGDLILPKAFGADVALVAEQRRRFLMSGRVRNVDVDEDISPDDAFLLPGEDKPHFAMDYFVFPRHIRWNLPPFAVGRPYWDQWMLYQARWRRIPVVDASLRTTVLHQLHDYSHIPHGRGQRWWGPEGDAATLLLMGHRGALTTRKFNLRDATYVLTRAGDVVRAPGARGLGRVSAEKRIWGTTALGHWLFRQIELLFSPVQRLRRRLAIRTRFLRAVHRHRDLAT